MTLAAPDRAARLAQARWLQPIDDEQAQILFGVGLATIERIEAGEVEPDGDVAARIDRFLATRGGNA